MWIGGFGGLYTNMSFRSNYEEIKPMELVNYGNRKVRVGLRRKFHTLEEFEACDAVAKLVLKVTEDEE